MSYHVPMCPVCNELEVGSYGDSAYYCSPTCEGAANAEYEWQPYDLIDDGDALASAGFGTDEDYGYYGDGDDYYGDW